MSGNVTCLAGFMNERTVQLPSLIDLSASWTGPQEGAP